MRSFALSRVVALSLLLSVGLSTGGSRFARAQPSNKAAADVLFDQGKKLMGENKFAEACPKFAESQRLDPAPGTLVWLADCYEKNGQIATAWSTYREALAAARTAGQPKRETLAKDRIAVLEKLLSTLTIRIAEKDLAGLEVKVDGQPIGKVLWATPIPYDPGVHTVEATAPNRTPYKSQIEIGTSASQITVDVPALQPAPPPAPPTSAAPAPTQAPAPVASAAPAPAKASEPTPPLEKSSQRTVGLVVTTAGVAVGVTGLIVALTSSSSAQKAIDACRAHTVCTPGDKSDYDSAKTRNTVGVVVASVGAAMVVGGFALVLTAPSPSSPRGTWLTPQVGSSFAGLSLGGNL